MRSERGSSTILHCLQWYKLVLRTRLSTAAVQYPIVTQAGADCRSLARVKGRAVGRGLCERVKTVCRDARCLHHSLTTWFLTRVLLVLPDMAVSPEQPNPSMTNIPLHTITNFISQNTSTQNKSTENDSDVHIIIFEIQKWWILKGIRDWK